MRSNLCRWACLAMAAVLTGCGGGRAKLPAGAEREPRNARALDAFGSERLVYGAIVSEHAATASFICTQPLKDHPDLLMIVAFCSPAIEGFPVMQLRVGAPITGADGIPSEISPRVVCDLDVSQADAVIARGIPDALAAAMVEEVRKHELKTQGAHGNQVLYLEPGMFFRIDAQPYLVPPVGPPS